MARGNEREKSREKAAARAKKNQKGGGTSAPKVGGANANADALAAKIAAKKAAKEAGTYVDKRAGKAPPPGGKVTKKVETMINPHTGKKDAEYTKKQIKKAAAGK